MKNNHKRRKNKILEAKSPRGSLMLGPVKQSQGQGQGQKSPRYARAKEDSRKRVLRKSPSPRQSINFDE